MIRASIAFATEWPTMHFVFYPKHEFGCRHVDHCPHLGGASLGWLVHAADERTEWTDSLLRQIDGLRAESASKSDTIAQLAARIEQLECELKAERQMGKRWSCVDREARGPAVAFTPRRHSAPQEAAPRVHRNVPSPCHQRPTQARGKLLGWEAILLRWSVVTHISNRPPESSLDKDPSGGFTRFHFHGSTQHSPPIARAWSLPSMLGVTPPRPSFAMAS
jgi:hypothetical protein